MKKPKIFFYYDYFIIGALVTILALILNQQFPITLSIASILTPTGAKLTISGIHIKHWIIGFVILIPSILFMQKSPKVSSLFSAIGLILIIDEIGDIIKFITTGNL